MPYSGLQVFTAESICFSVFSNSLKKQYLCEKCCSVFSKPYYLSLHMKHHAFACTFCSKKYMRMSLLKQHIQIEHTMKKEKLKEELEESQRKYVNEEFIEIKKMELNEALRETQKIELNDELKETPSKEWKEEFVESTSTNITCEKCPLVFNSKRLYKTHFWQIHRKRYVCLRIYCNKSFKTKDEYDTHIKNHELAPCNFCGKKVKRPEIHFMLHSGKKYPCKLCNKNFRQYANLRRHMLIHLKIRPYTCSTCGKSFTQRCNLVTHLRHHTATKPYKCTICNMDFARSSTLKLHVKGIHKRDDARKYKCNICTFTAVTQWRVNYHMKIIHKGSLPRIFKCNICSKILSTEYYLERHYLIHKENKPYSCTQCISDFATKSNLTRHVKRYHS